MSFYDTLTGQWSETDPRVQIDIEKLKQQFPDCGIVVRSDGVVEIQKPVSPTEKSTFVLK